MTTLAQFDAATQERAMGVLNMLCTQYRISANLLRAEEVGAAVTAATTGQGSDDAGFSGRMWEALLSTVHRRMSEYAERGEDLPTTLDPSQYALLRKGLVAKFGPLPDAAPDLPVPGPGSGSDTPADTRSADEQVAAMLRSKAPADAPIDPEVAALFRG